MNDVNDVFLARSRRSRFCASIWLKAELFRIYARSTASTRRCQQIIHSLGVFPGQKISGLLHPACQPSP
jgi:hypothetical protein